MQLASIKKRFRRVSVIFGDREKISVNFTSISQDVGHALVVTFDFKFEALFEDSHDVLRVFEIFHGYLEENEFGWDFLSCANLCAFCDIFDR